MQIEANPCLCSGRLHPRGHQPRTREDGVETATLDFGLSDEEIRLLSQIASGVTADVAARKLELSARTLRRRLRNICDRLEVSTPIEAVVWAARRQLI
jgi:DNA-binding NarL/FixJ family response regulator